MSEKEYKVEYHGDYVTVKEVEPSYSNYTTNPNPTLRERMGKKIRATKKSTKIILTLCFNIYGILYRIGANRTSSVVFGIFNAFSTSVSIMLLPFMIIAAILYFYGMVHFNDIKEMYTFIIYFLIIPIPFIIQIIDLLSVAISGDIVFLKMKKRKNYWER